MGTINGATLMARSLKQQGVDYLFGIVGFPVVPIARAAQREGITYIGCRNEQAASYAAQAAGYLTGRPQACLTVPGPGVVHALAGLANAKANWWPMVLIGGASAIYQNGMGAFQEESQVMVAAPFCKYAHGVETVARIPYYVEQAVRHAWYGRPGPTYLDMPDDIILGQIEEEEVRPAATLAPPPRPLADPKEIERAIELLKAAKKPLVIVGKGMAWARAEDEVREFIERTKLPFLASPMGKGVVSDLHPLSVGAARSYALQEADAILLLGARLNWIMHFGLSPRFNPDVKVIQLDISPEQISTNVPAAAALVGDGRAVMAQLNAALEAQPWSYDPETPWRAGIANKITENAASVEAMRHDDSVPMNYYRAYKDIVDWLPDDALIVGEGANTMDIGRTQMANTLPRHRLDAGSYGTMGVGMGFALAAAVTNPGKRVVAVQGDSAFGFSGMELETAARYNLPITVVILNNNGIGGGPVEMKEGQAPPPNALLPTARYERIAEAFGGVGYHVEHPKDLRPALDAAAESGTVAVVHVRINPRADRKPQQFAWHT